MYFGCCPRLNIRYPSALASRANREKSESAQDTWEPCEYRCIEFDTSLPAQVKCTLGGTGAGSKELSGEKIQSPHKMSRPRKEVISWLCYLSAALASHAASAYSPAKEQLMEYWQIAAVPVLVGITTFTTGFALAPMAFAPLSEVFGRKPVFIYTGVLFVVCQICCGATSSYPGMLVAQFFAGVGGSTYSSMVGGVISDLYASNERNTPMALFSCAALFGVGTGAVASGFTAQYTTWRWVFYSQAIANGILVGSFALFFSETRSTVLLRRKASEFNALHKMAEQAAAAAGDADSIPRIRWKSREDEQRSSVAKLIKISVTRPFCLLFTEPVVFFFSLWAAFAWAVLYVALAAAPLVFSTVYGFSLSESNAILASMCVGSVMFAPLSIYQEKFARHLERLPDTPEARLYFSCVESALLPVGLFVFAWTVNAAVHWIVPAIAIGIATMGIFSIYLAVFNYLSDTYGSVSSSTLAAQSFCRNGLGGVLTLVTKLMFTKMGYGPAGSCLGGIALALTLVPWALVFFGKEIRQRSRFAE
ncbi:major facilitator superfamily domain-containing protein [Phyllosticta capitalensis]|uniref:Major facilitator superfamily domain-containing protein n=1 Tax=Phyllosticta capitalensis TaxID=121624 RepID=A0ABR1YKS7_9PEZI